MWFFKRQVNVRGNDMKLETPCIMEYITSIISIVSFFNQVKSLSTDPSDLMNIKLMILKYKPKIIKIVEELEIILESELDMVFKSKIKYALKEVEREIKEIQYRVSYNEGINIDPFEIRKYKFNNSKKRLRFKLEYLILLYENKYID